MADVHSFAWRVNVRKVGYVYFAFYALPRVPFQHDRFELRQDARAGAYCEDCQ